NLEEKNRLVAGNMIVRPFLPLLDLILERVAGIATVSDNANSSLCCPPHKLARQIVKFDFLNAQFRRAPHARNQRSGDNRKNEKRGNLDSLWSFMNILQRGVRENDRN